jgi:hypothetical protein
VPFALFFLGVEAVGGLLTPRGCILEILTDGGTEEYEKFRSDVLFGLLLWQKEIDWEIQKL